MFINKKKAKFTLKKVNAFLFKKIIELKNLKNTNRIHSQKTLNYTNVTKAKIPLFSLNMTS